MSLPSPLLIAACAPPLRRIFAANPWAVEKLGEFNGQTIFLEVGSSFRLGLLVSATEGLVPSAHAESSTADLHVRLPAAALPDLLAGRDAAMAAAQITGAVDFAEAISFVLRNLRVDAGEMLAPVTGDLLAYRIAQMLKTGGRLARRTTERMHAGFTEYLQFESGLFVERATLADLRADSRAFAARLEQLAARIARLEPNSRRVE